MEPVAISHFCAYLRTRNYSPHTVENYHSVRKTPALRHGDIRTMAGGHQRSHPTSEGFPMKPLALAMGRSHRFPLSYRDVQELLLERGIDVTHEAIRQWCLKFGQDYANRLKRRRAQPGDKWHLDEVFLTIKPTVSPLLTPVASRTGGSTVNRGHEHHRSIRRCSVRA